MIDCWPASRLKSVRMGSSIPVTLTAKWYRWWMNNIQAPKYSFPYWYFHPISFRTHFLHPLLWIAITVRWTKQTQYTSSFLSFILLHTRAGVTRLHPSARARHFPPPCFRSFCCYLWKQIKLHLALILHGFLCFTEMWDFVGCVWADVRKLWFLRQN